MQGQVYQEVYMEGYTGTIPTLYYTYPVLYPALPCCTPPLYLLSTRYISHDGRLERESPH